MWNCRVPTEDVYQTMSLGLTVNVTMATAAVSVTYVRRHFISIFFAPNPLVFVYV